MPQRRLVSAPLVLGELSLGVRVEIGTVTPQGEHQQHFGVHPRRTNVRGCEPLDGRIERVSQEHTTISPRRHRDTEEIVKEKSSKPISQLHWPARETQALIRPSPLFRASAFPPDNG